MFNYGDTGKKFFIIIQGKVEVLIPIGQNHSLIQVAILDDGKSFGDLALLKDAPRNATISCLTDCHFATLFKDDYLRILGRIEDSKINQFTELLKQIPVFKNWGKRNIHNLYHFFKPIKFHRNNSVFSPGDASSQVFIIKTGEFELSKQIKTDKKTKFNLKVAILTRGEMIGVDDVLQSKPRELSCSCYSSEGELIAISAKDFLLKIKSDESLAIFLKNHKQKFRMRELKEKIMEKVFDWEIESQTIEKFRKGNFTIMGNRNSETLNLQVGARKVLKAEEKSKKRDLELTLRDIRNIRGRAFGRSTSRMFIVMNRPAEFSVRTPSPFLRRKYRKKERDEASECF